LKKAQQLQSFFSSTHDAFGLLKIQKSIEKMVLGDGKDEKGRIAGAENTCI
jgi:hypothetical protein